MGTFFWIAQRVSALIILSYVLFILISYFVKPYQYDASIWYFDIHTTAMKVFTSAFLVVMVSHALQGLKAIEDDYFTERTIGMFMPGMTYLAKFLKYAYRSFIGLVILVLAYVVVFNYLMEL